MRLLFLPGEGTGPSTWRVTVVVTAGSDQELVMLESRCRCSKGTILVSQETACANTLDLATEVTKHSGLVSSQPNREHSFISQRQVSDELTSLPK